MAEEVIKIVIDDSGAVENLDQIKQSLEGIKEKSANDAAQGVMSVRKELRLIQQELATLDAGSDKFIELSQKAGALKDQLKDASESINANAGPAFETLGNNVSLLKDRFMTADFEGVGQSFKAIAANIRAVKFDDIVGGIKMMGTSLGAVGKALLTNPIFLIGAAIAAAIVYSKELLSLVDGISSEEQEALKASQDRAKAQEDALNSIGEQENILKLQGKSERDILKMKIQQGQEAINAAKIALEQQKQLRQQQIDAAERNKNILKGLLDFVSLPLTAILAGFDMLSEKARDWGLITEETYNKLGNLRERFKESTAKLLFDPEQTAKDTAATLAENESALRKLENQVAGSQLALRQMDKSAAEAKAKQREEELKKNEEEISKLVQMLDEQTAREIEREKKAAAEKEKIRQEDAARAFQANQDRIAAEEAFYQASTELNQTAQEKEIAATVKKFEELYAVYEAAGEDTAILAERQRQEIAEINKRYDDEEKERARQVQAAKVQLTSDGIGALIALNNAFAGTTEKEQRKAFERNKKLQIAQALIQTYQSATAAYASQLTIPSPDAPIRAAVAAGIAVASGLAQVAAIARTSFQGSGGGGASGAPSAPSIGGGGGGSFAPTPSFTAPRMSQQEQEPMRAYVVSRDITRQGEAQRITQRQSEIG